MNDLISRQAAIEAAWFLHPDDRDALRDTLAKLPSAHQELIRALNYDRNQYEKGYSDGIRCGERKIGKCTNESRYFHCSECGYGVMDVCEGNYSRENEIFVFEKGGEWHFCPNCGAVME